MSSKLKNIPTNIITGFLGVGKTTAILHLLQQKPADERWAILVNEFGEIGIDGSLFQGTNTEQQGIFIREVPGGCMCCAAGLPMQIALNMLLAHAKPHRLLIEPTGLGHPKEVIEVLSSEHYREILDLQNTITIVDARKVSDSRYTEHTTFNQQLNIADIIVANKSDQYQTNDFAELTSYLENQHWINNKTIYQVSMGKVQLKWLQGKAREFTGKTHHHQHTKPAQQLPMPDDKQFPPCGYLTMKNQGEGFHSQGWLFKPEFIFNQDKLYSLLLGIKVERLKGVFITHTGIIGYNKVDGVLTEVMLDEAMDSRIEIITSDTYALQNIEQDLLSVICG
ncbi:GTP-binding protein [Endozoicomonas sp. SM1973]|uniref:GTP-binding protein n=1 Tax=Spartinivicinus marinus TaxID=2994442 RepID=A0A853HZ67_9GAMM|nr:GTP-binding protein [Spartinivicinus marinus]MCX4027024.1 GTP-binding protein [Spartinivicinus marinus]NYZ67020.1 GTP-binding protein [Spartinivicinus marinus]